MTNARLQNLFKLSSKVTIYVPATINVNEVIDNTKYVDETASLLSELFGGATSTKALGYWKSASGELVKEETTMVFAYADEEDMHKNLGKAIDHCYKLLRDMKQESIAMEVNGEMYFIAE